MISTHSLTVMRYVLTPLHRRFRSSGTSNAGRNYPGLWLPTAGICPYWFQQRVEGRPWSYADFPADDSLAVEAASVFQALSGVALVLDGRHVTVTRRLAQNRRALDLLSAPVEEYCRMTQSTATLHALSPLDARRGHTHHRSSTSASLMLTTSQRRARRRASTGGASSSNSSSARPRRLRIEQTPRTTSRAAATSSTASRPCASSSRACASAARPGPPPGSAWSRTTSWRRAAPPGWRRRLWLRRARLRWW